MGSDNLWRLFGGDYEPPESEDIDELWQELEAAGITVPADSREPLVRVLRNPVDVRWSLWRWEYEVIEQVLAEQGKMAKEALSRPHSDKVELEQMLALNVAVTSYLPRWRGVMTDYWTNHYVATRIVYVSPSEALLVLRWFSTLEQYRQRRLLSRPGPLTEPDLRDEYLLDAAEHRLRQVLTAHPLHAPLLVTFDSARRKARYGPGVEVDLPAMTCACPLSQRELVECKYLKAARLVANGLDDDTTPPYSEAHLEALKNYW